MALLLAYGTLCIPFCNAFTPLIFGVWACINGVRGIRMSRGLKGCEEELGVTPLATTLHRVIGIACIPLGALPVLLNVIGFFYWLLMN
jgi:hypothetical protein